MNYRYLFIICIIILIILFYNNLIINIIPKNIIQANKITEKNIKFITFSDEKIYKSKRIMRQAKNSCFFKELKNLSINNLDSDFYQKHINFINKNKRGFGYWIWKPQIILQNILQLDEGDILVYCDSGFTIQNNSKRVIEYYNMLINSKSGILSFNINFIEKEWNKSDLIKILDPNKIHIDDNQICSGVFMIKKCQNSMNMILEWSRLSQIYHCLDDSPSFIPNEVGFQEHRHDQSIFSLLCKNYNAIICSDNFSDKKEDFNLSDGSLRPFVPTRIK
jgi:hypothetical protein